MDIYYQRFLKGKKFFLLENNADGDSTRLKWRVYLILTPSDVCNIATKRSVCSSLYRHLYVLCI